MIKNVTLSMLLMHSLDIGLSPAAVKLFNVVLKGDEDIQVKLKRFKWDATCIDRINPWKVCIHEMKGYHLDEKKFPKRETAYDRKL